MRRFASAALALAGALWTAGCSVAGERGGTPEPAFTVVERLTDDVEVRRYGPRVAAEARVEGGRNRAFGLLFDYISGANGGAAKIAMTTPVATDEAQGARIDMTAPVAEGDGFAMRFFLPDRYDAETAPRPTDPRVRIVALPAAEIAVLRFSGLRTDYAIARARDRLAATLERSGWAPTGPAESWFYDPPWTLPPFRRNEIAVPVARR